jgi:hypothetical protein
LERRRSGRNRGTFGTAICRFEAGGGDAIVDCYTQGGEQDMANHPVVTKVLCVALVASIMLPVGRMIFPFIDTAVSGLQFDAIQAVLSASLGFGLHAAIFS